MGGIQVCDAGEANPFHMKGGGNYFDVIEALLIRSIKCT
jgi:hypothetical protein